MNDAPKRNHVVVIRIGADGPEEVMRALRNLETDFIMEGLRSLTLGGPDYGMDVSVTINPDVTHESYFAAVDEYLSAIDESD